MTHSVKFRTARRVLGAALVAGVALVGVTACSSSGGKAAESSAAAPAGGGAVADTPRLTIAMVTHSPAGDTFWDMVQRGAEAAAAKDNVELKYAGDADASKQALLLQNAIDSKVDGIAVTLTKPDAMADGMAKAKAAGIPVVAINAGLDDWQDLGAISFFGLDIDASGVVSGQQLADQGGKNGLCVIQEEGSVVLEELCKGAQQGFGGTMETLNVNGTDLTSVQSQITAKLQTDPTIDSIVTLNAPIGLAAVQANKDAGTKAQITTLNVTKEVVDPVKNGEILAVIDQQGWLQGYEAVDALWLNKTNGNVLGGGKPVLTGPTLVTKDNIDEIAPFVAAGTR